MDQELEIKLALSPRDARKLAKKKGFKSGGAKRHRNRRLISTYFDTPRHLLRKSNIALRIRDDGDRKTQTIKTPFAGPIGMQSMRELSTRVRGSEPELDRISHPELMWRLSPDGGAHRLDSVFTTDVERTTLQLRARGADVELAVDQGVIRTGHNGHKREEPICEAELELLSGDPVSLLDVALEVCESYDVRLLHMSKADRGYALARRSLRPSPKKPARVELSRSASAGQAFEIIMAGALEHLFANQVPVLQQHPGGVHQTRVALRRLRAGLRAFKMLLPYHERKAFNNEFRWFQKRLAPARDWHVFLTETLPQIADHYPASTARLERIRRLARDERRRTTADAIECLQSRRYTRLILQFQRWLATLRDDIPAEVFDQPLLPFARAVLAKTRRDLLREERSLTHLPAEDLHGLRKLGKKVRYATEFFSYLWKRDSTKLYLRLMESLQDSLGEANDASVARHILWTVSPGKLDAEAVRLVQDWSQDRVTDCIRAARQPWSEYRAIEPFWENDRMRNPRPLAE
ncbi:MAG: CYTH and CHAD domain-containing protein [Gammaproteobacteria bacterium]|nr:CYTH and CHAD domain-containing protein [Gammaproteobacteria bacterium]NND36625.1 CYTH and CHAD domain-containing protein [Gammaproteobacteria bacterium]